MPNELTFTDPIVLPLLKYAKVALAREVDDTAKRVVLEVQFYGDNGVFHPNRFSIDVTNGVCGKVFVAESPETTTAILTLGVLTPNDNLAISNAFDLVMYEYMTGGLTAVLNKLQELGALPAGTAA